MSVLSEPTQARTDERYFFSIVILMSTALAGCSKSTTVVTVNADGSGGVTQKILINKELIEMSSMFEKGNGQKNSPDKRFYRKNAEDLAVKMGMTFALLNGFV